MKIIHSHGQNIVFKVTSSVGVAAGGAAGR
jgi:hypothetical protein